MFQEWSVRRSCIEGIAQCSLVATYAAHGVELEVLLVGLVHAQSLVPIVGYVLAGRNINLITLEEHEFVREGALAVVGATLSSYSLHGIDAGFEGEVGKGHGIASGLSLFIDSVDVDNVVGGWGENLLLYLVVDTE